ncbi:MAG: M42 family metallopeptidase [Candidatus Njordarchaeales archaeon]
MANREEIISLLEKLSNAFGPPGFEDEVREIVKEELEGVTSDIRVDALGNLIAYKKGSENYPVVMLDAHMDEVGFLITHIDKRGFLRFQPLGGFDERVLYAQQVVIRTKNGDKILGFIGAKAPHLLKPEERSKVLGIDELFIDIGATSEEEAREMGIEIGSVGTFATKFTRLSRNRVMGKAFDDRVGLTVMITAMKMLKDTNYNIIGVASVQEEVGLRGARTAAWQATPDLALALEGTAAADIPGTPEHKESTAMGKGPAITIADRSIIAHPKIVKLLVNAAEENNIPYQFKRVIAGGTDAGVIHLTKGGVPAGVVSVPCRYIHGPAAFLDLRDLENTIKLVVAFVRKASEEFKKE